MKIKAIKSLCEKSGMMQLLTERTGDGEYARQWISNGRCMYAVEGLPPMTAENICMMFDWGEKKLEKMVIEDKMLPEALNMNYDRNDDPVVEMDIRLVAAGREHILYEELDRVWFVEESLLSPVKDEMDHISLSRRGEGQLMVMRGMDVVGIVYASILPFRKEVAKVLCEMNREKPD